MTHPKIPQRIALISTLGILTGGIIVGVIRGVQLDPPVTQTGNKKVDTNYPSEPKNTRAEYERLVVGKTTLTAAEAILGRGIEVEDTGTSKHFHWKNFDGSSINLFFKNDVLISKKQDGLQ